MMEEIDRIKYKRAIVPPDAKNLDIVTIDTGDAISKYVLQFMLVLKGRMIHFRVNLYSLGLRSFLNVQQYHVLN